MFDNYVFPYKDQIHDTGIEVREDICVLLFFMDKTMVAQSVVTRDIDFAPIAQFGKDQHLNYLTPNLDIGWDKENDGRYKVKLIH